MSKLIFRSLIISLPIFILYAGDIFSASIDFSGKVRIGPGMSSYSDHQSNAVNVSGLNLDMYAHSRLGDGTYADFRINSNVETIFSPARRSLIGFSIRQDLKKIADKNVDYVFEYNNIKFADKLTGDRNFNEDGMLFGMNYRPYNFLLTYLKYMYTGRTVDFSADSFSLGRFTLGTSFWLNNRKDTFRINMNTHKKDSKTDTRDYKRMDTMFSYNHSFDNLDSAGGEIEIDEFSYGESGKILSNDTVRLRAYYDDDFPDGTRRFTVRVLRRAYPNNSDVDYDEYFFTHKKNVYETVDKGESSSRQELAHYNNKGDAGNDYLQWLWGYKKYTRNIGKRGLYLSNRFLGRAWKNFPGSNLKEDFIEDTLGGGVRWRSFEKGTFEVGPSLGYRLYFNPLSRTNSISTDNSYLRNPNNYFFYGFNMSGRCSPLAAVELIIDFDYRRYVDYNAISGDAENELVSFGMHLTQVMGENVRLINKINYSSNIDDIGAVSQGAYAFNYELSVEYLFSARFSKREK